jgi:parvulin-like peptidyl-prolyl isomerase
MKKVVSISIRDLIVIGVLILSVAANIYLLLSNKSPQQSQYKQSLEVNDEAIKREQEFRKAVQAHIEISEAKLRTYQVRDSVLFVEQEKLEYRLNQIQHSYEKINDRYRAITTDSIRRLFAQ